MTALDHAISFRIEGELTRANLVKARDQLGELLDDSPAQTSDAKGDGDLPARKVEALWDRSPSPASWNFLHEAAHRYDDEEFTFLDFAKDLEESDATVKAWHRNLSRSIKPVNEALGADPPFMEERWDGTKQHYRIPNSIREPVLRFGRKS
jgi:hypothetical protein